MPSEWEVELARTMVQAGVDALEEAKRMAESLGRQFTERDGVQAVITAALYALTGGYIADEITEEWVGRDVLRAQEVFDRVRV